MLTHSHTSIWLRPLEKYTKTSSSDRFPLRPTGENKTYSFQQMEYEEPLPGRENGRERSTHGPRLVRRRVARLARREVPSAQRRQLRRAPAAGGKKRQERLRGTSRREESPFSLSAVPRGSKYLLRVAFGG